MKKYTGLLMGVALFFVGTGLVGAAPSQEVNVTIDGEKKVFNQPAMMHSGSVMVPMRAIFEELGAELHWNETTRTVTASKGDISVQLTVNKLVALVNGEEVTLNAEPIVQNGATFVPLRFISESLGGSASWDEGTKTAHITSNDATTALEELEKIKTFANEGTTAFTKAVKAGDHARFIYEKFGEPSAEYQYRASQFIDYETNNLYITFAYIGEQGHETPEGNYALTDRSTIDFISVHYRDKQFTYEEIKSIFGEPDGRAYDYISLKTQIFYIIGDYQLYFQVSEPNNEDDALDDSVTFNEITVREKL